MSGQERAAADIRREYVIEGQTRLADAVMELRLAGDTRRITAPGQFVNIALPGLFLRRPISVSDWDSQGMILVYKIVGEGTKRLAQARPGQRLDLLTGLGNGFDPAAAKSGERPLVVGGGVGVPPMLGLTKALAKEVGPCGIRVNCVAPGAVDTEMNRRLSREERTALEEETPLLRLGTPEEIASLLVFLAGEQAGFITGQVISPNGGLVI